MRPHRVDEPGTRWMITNRGIAKRAVFETRHDVERFCELLAEVVELGLLEVCAFVFMTTHFHLLLESTTGEISRAMRLVGNGFVRWFNRSRKRDGPLFAGRFHGRVIRDDAHWLNALRYIDLNPVRARMCRIPSDHPFGSARAYRFDCGPDWLARAPVERVVTESLGLAAFDPTLYDAFACAVDQEANAHLIERLERSPHHAAPPLSDLIRTAVRLLSRDPPRGPARTLDRDVETGLLRDAAGLQITEVADMLGLARSTVTVALRRHEGWMRDVPRYHDAVARALQSAVRRTLEPRRHALALPARIAPVGAAADPGAR